MAILPIYLYDQSVLRKKARPVKSASDEVAALASDMLETMHGAHGVGLAANQVGSLDRVIVVDLSGIEEMKDFEPLIMLNPEVVSEEGKWLLEEGCLSIPDIREEVERAEKIRVRYRDLSFADCMIEAEGFLGRVILHEIDHLNGVLFVDHLNPVKRKLLRGRLNKMKRGEVEVDYPVVSPAEPKKHLLFHTAAKA